MSTSNHVDMEKILITGGTGFIGRELRALLLREGKYLTVITRDTKKYADESAKNQRFIGWDDDLVQAMNEVDAVIHLAGEGVFEQRWTDEVKRRIYDSRIDTTHKLVDAIAKAENKPGVLISASGSGFYGNRGTDILDESQGVAEDFLAQVCNDWEAESRKATEFGVRVVNARIGIVLEQDGGALKKMVPPFQFFVGGPVADGKQFMSWIHRVDLLQALIFPLSNSNVSGPYNVCSPNPVDMNEFSDTLGSVLNRPVLFRVPAFAIEMMYGEGAKPILDSIRMQPKVLQTNGFVFEYEELEEALADILG